MTTADPLGRPAGQPYDKHRVPTPTPGRNPASDLPPLAQHWLAGFPNQRPRSAHSNHDHHTVGRHEEGLRP